MISSGLFLGFITVFVIGLIVGIAAGISMEKERSVREMKQMYDLDREKREDVE